MSTAQAIQTFAGTVHDAEQCWYDTDGWSAWIDGLAHVVSVEGDWPQVGSVVTWESGPAGRGRVTERVVAYDPLVGLTSEVRDETLTGTQSVTFTPGDDEVTVELSLAYRIRRRSIVTPLVDLVFVRRAMTMSLRSTLAHFGAHLAAAR
jgi:hypothetical protein